jgi:hypothetical protein
LKALDFDLTLTGFSLGGEIGSLLGETTDGIKDTPESKYKEQSASSSFARTKRTSKKCSKAWRPKAMTSE